MENKEFNKLFSALKDSFLERIEKLGELNDNYKNQKLIALCLTYLASEFARDSFYGENKKTYWNKADYDYLKDYFLEAFDDFLEFMRDTDNNSLSMENLN